jgi:mono/diheme cytochrome c family protein
MKKPFCCIAACLVVCALAVSGCGLDQHPPYSDSVEFGVRQDPIVRQAAKLGDERYEPDRPGVLPIMRFDDIKKPDHPMHAKAAEINDVMMRDPLKMNDKDRKELGDALKKLFGTPANPTINAKEADISAEVISSLKIDDETIREGSKHYRVHCLHCHGVPGDGRGPTARRINPHPRDFRSGIFKFQSVNQADGQTRKPFRADLERTIRQGIEGTAMPTFGILSDREIDLLVSYVIYLSIRGETETSIINVLLDFQNGALVFGGAGGQFNNIAQGAAALAGINAGAWNDSNNPANKIKIEPYKELNGKELADSVKRGHQLFVADKAHPRGEKANCKQCHDDYGRQARFRFDDWGTLARPNNFPIGVFRGGKRPVDLYYRIHSGINGSGMARFGSAGVLEGQDIWDLINFIQVLPYSGMHKELGIRIN